MNRIIKSLESAVAYARGDKSRGRSTIVRVAQARGDIFEAIAGLRQALVASKASIDYVNDPAPLCNDKRLAISRTSKRLAIAIVALDDIKAELQKST